VSQACPSGDKRDKIDPNEMAFGASVVFVRIASLGLSVVFVRDASFAALVAFVRVTSLGPSAVFVWIALFGVSEGLSSSFNASARSDVFH
jgi:hypothetical protein